MSGIDLADPAATEAIGLALARIVAPGDVVTLAGPLGTGKTTLARGLLAGLGLVGEVPSPSFAIVIAYEPPDVALPVSHVDLYRLDAADELAELGLDDGGEGVLLIEWPDRAGDGAWPGALALTLTPLAGGGRRLTWTAGASWHRRWPPPPLP